MDLASLRQSAFDREYFDTISNAAPAKDLSDAREIARTQNTRLHYDSFQEFQMLARYLGLMTDEKAGIPRTAYRGVVEVRPHGEHILFLTPKLSKLQGEFHQTAR